MENQPLNRSTNPKLPSTFFVLVFLTSAIFWLLGAVSKQVLPEETSINLPISSLMAICPITVALILVYREHGSGGVKDLLKRSFNYRSIKKKIWFVPVFFLMPAIMILVNGMKGGMQIAIPDLKYPVMMVLILCLIFLIEAIAEEVGWQGYAFDPMQERWNALTASIILGIFWAVWHLVPFIQMNQSADWIVWQSLNMVATRIIIVCIYNNTGKSIFAAILYHAMNNVSTMLLPSFGLIYDPTLTTVILIVVTLVITFLWGPKTLARYRYAKLDQGVYYPSP